MPVSNVRLAFGLLASASLLCSASINATAETASPSPGAPTTLQDAPSDSLSKKLDKTGGVISPKDDVDPGIKASAPVAHPNSTLVIPPSATGGQNAK